MIAGFFTWSENVSITRGIKIVGRLGMMVTTILIYFKIIRYGAVNSIFVKELFSPAFYFAYLFLGLISIFWSTNAGYSILQWFMVAQSMVFALFFIKNILLLNYFFEGHTIKLHRLLGDCAFGLLLIFVVGMWIDPNTFFRLTNGGEEERLGGILMNPNELGMLAGVGIACLLLDFHHTQKRILVLGKIVVLLYALYMTGSRSSLIGVLLIFLLHFNFLHNKYIKFAMVVIAISIVPFAVYQMIFKGGDSQRMEELFSLTGRLPFWKALIMEGLPREPLLGFGFMRIDYNEYFQSVHTYPGKMTHNTFIQVLMNLGFVGLVLVLFQVFFTIVKILGQKGEKRLLLIGIFIPILINSFTEFGIFGESNYGILFYQMIIFYISLEHQPHFTSKQRLLLQKKRPDFTI